jgi:SAM-dependent methyltransferase
MKSSPAIKSSRKNKRVAKVAREREVVYLTEETPAEKALIEGQVTKLNGGFNDPAFADNKTKPIHRWIPWIAGFSSGFVHDVFTRCLPAKDNGPVTVLDPFCGVGTTLVEAVLRGYDSVGFEINPYAALASRAKLEAAAISPSQFHLFISKFREHMASEKSPHQTAQPPAFFNSRIPFFGSQTQPKILRALRFIRGIRVAPVRDLFSLAFGSVMVSLSNYSYEPSLGSRPGCGKPLQDDAPVAETLLKKLEAMHADIGWLRSQMEKFERLPKGRVIADNFMNAASHLEADSVDLVVTSPPYLNNYHYVRNTRPQLFWLGFVQKPKDLKRLEVENFGKYWQTVRDMKPLPLDFENAQLEQLLARIRAVNVDRGIYGGNGWANYATSYFNDIDRFCKTMSYVLKPEAYAVIVVGNSILQGVEIPIDNIFASISERHGFKTANIHVLRQKRVGASIVGSSVRQGEKTKARLYESAVVLQKTKNARAVSPGFVKTCQMAFDLR